MAVPTSYSLGDLHGMLDRLEAARPRQTVVVAVQDAGRVRAAYEQLERENPLCTRLEILTHPCVDPGQAILLPAGPEPASGVSAPGDSARSGKINGP
jgi:hypothetical protein